MAKAWVKQLDFSTCKSIKKSYVSPAYKETDMLYKVKFRGHNVYVYVLLEFQSNVQKFMIVRVLYYLASFYLDLIEQKERTLRRKYLGLFGTGYWVLQT